MKLVELLAKELPNWRSGADCATQEADSGLIYFWRTNSLLRNSEGSWVHSTGAGLLSSNWSLMVGAFASDHATAIVTRADWEAERANMNASAVITGKPKPNKDGWIRHRGGKCPVETGVLVDVRYRNGKVNEHVAALKYVNSGGSIKGYKATDWDHSGAPLDIMAFRIHKPVAETPDEKVMRECVEKCASTESEYEPIYNAQAIDHGPIQWRDRIAEIDTDSKVEEERHCAVMSAFDTERAELVQKLAGEGFALIERINKSLAEAKQAHEDLRDPDNWRPGDFVMCIDGQPSVFTVGCVYEIDYMEPTWCNVIKDDEGDSNAISPACFKFHSRPSA